MERFSWRPAALRAERTVTVSPEGLAFDEAAMVRWAEVEAVSFALDRARRVTMMTLRLRAKGEDVLLSVSGDGPEDAQYDRDAAQQLKRRRCQSRRRPELTINTIGNEEAGRGEAMFLMSARTR